MVERHKRTGYVLLTNAMAGALLLVIGGEAGRTCRPASHLPPRRVEFIIPDDELRWYAPRVELAEDEFEPPRFYFQRIEIDLLPWARSSPPEGAPF